MARAAVYQDPIKQTREGVGGKTITQFSLARASAVKENSQTISREIRIHLLNSMASLKLLAPSRSKLSDVFSSRSLLNTMQQFSFLAKQMTPCVESHRRGAWENFGPTEKTYFHFLRATKQVSHRCKLQFKGEREWKKSSISAFLYYTKRNSALFSFSFGPIRFRITGKILMRTWLNCFET